MAHPLIDDIRRAGVVAVLRAPSVEVALHAVDAIVRGGVTAIEVTYSTPEVTTVLAELALRWPGTLRALRGPFPDLRYLPTGGVSEANLADWFAAGALAVGAGSELIPRDALDAGDYDAITQRAARFVRALVSARG